MDGHSDSDDRINTDELVEYLQEAPIRLAVFGEFSAGKTTALNALIGEEILSVAVEPTTAVPTRIRYGREFNIFIERVDGETLTLFEDDPPFWTRFVGRRDTLNTLEKQQDTIRDFLQRWTKEGEKAGEVERVIIELPLDWLKGGIELVDTPGVNNEFVRHQGFTEQEAGDADIAVLLMDARQGGAKRTEFKFMNDVQQQVERCIVAPNKMDLVPADEREEFLGYIRETALPKHWEGAVTPPVMGISALAALHPEDHEEPGLIASFEEVRERLETLAREERGKLLLARKGNPEKQLFAQAREREAEGEYDRAHRLYFDLLDVMEAAGLDPTPAKEGVARCEENLSAQVDTLDELNERYNEAMTLAEEDPDSALERLESIRDEKEELRLEDGDLHASIEQLQSRVEERDAARTEIRQLRRRAEEYRRNGDLVRAAEAAKKTLPLTEAAELSEEETQELRAFIEKQESDRNEWKKRRRDDVEEALQTAQENPDVALSQLREVCDERKILDGSDVNLLKKIRVLEERVRSRNESRKKIRALKEKAENYQHGGVGEAVESAKEILTHLEEADLSSEKEESLHRFVHQVCEEAKKRWKELKEKADTCVAEHQYVNAKDYLDELKEVAPYKPLVEETEAFVEEVREKAELEADYHRLARSVVEEAEVLHRDRVGEGWGEVLKSEIEELKEPYQALYGDLDLPKQMQFGDSGLFLTIHQKLGLARQIRAVVGYSPARDKIASLLDELRARRGEIEALSRKGCDRLDLLEEYPDHPKAEEVLDDVLNERSPLWTHPSEIRRMITAVEEYRDYLPEKKVEERVEELERRASFFKWIGFLGFFPILVSFSAAEPTPFVFIGIMIITVGGSIWYQSIQSGVEGGYSEPEDINSNDSGKALDKGHTTEKWKCPSCGTIKKKEEGYKKVWCPRCITIMDFYEERPQNGESTHDTAHNQEKTVPDEGYPAGTWKCPDCRSRRERGDGFKRVICQQCGSEMEFDYKSSNNVGQKKIKKLYDNSK